MGKNLKGKELGAGISQRKDGRYSARFVTSSGKRIENAKKSALILSETLSRFHIPVKTVGFTTRGTPTFYHYGEWDNSEENRIRLMGMKPGGGTFLGFSIRYAGELLRRQKTKHRIFVMITDGCPEAPQYRSLDEAFSDVRDGLLKIQKDADVIGIGLCLILKYGAGVGLDVNVWIFILIVFAIMQGTQFVDNFIYQPLIYSTSIRANPLEIFIVLLIAGHVGGVVGMLVAIPSYTVIRVIASRFFYKYKPVRRLIPEREQDGADRTV